MPESSTETAPSCSTCTGFNYCFWAKFIVGVPALTVAGYFVAVQFANPIVQIAAFPVTVCALMWVAIKIDHMPVFSKKVINRTCDTK